MCERHPDPCQQLCNCGCRLFAVLDDQPEQIGEVLQRVPQSGQLGQLLAPAKGRRYDVEGWQGSHRTNEVVYFVLQREGLRNCLIGVRKINIRLVNYIIIRG